MKPINSANAASRPAAIEQPVAIAREVSTLVWPATESRNAAFPTNMNKLASAPNPNPRSEKNARAPGQVWTWVCAGSTGALAAYVPATGRTARNIRITARIKSAKLTIPIPKAAGRPWSALTASQFRFAIPITCRPVPKDKAGNNHAAKVHLRPRPRYRSGGLHGLRLLYRASPDAIQTLLKIIV